MLNDDVTVDKAEKVRAAIVCDLVKWASNDNAFANQFASFITNTHPKAKYGDRRIGEATTDALMMVEKKPIYRLKLNEKSGIDTDCYDLISSFQPELKQHYADLSELPMWVQEKLAVLMVLDHTKVNDEVVGIGRRISKDVFWIYSDGANS